MNVNQVSHGALHAFELQYLRLASLVGLPNPQKHLLFSPMREPELAPSLFTKIFKHIS
jgi:hypothetical protein